ncbi:DUF4396 domain-containing protein [Pelagibacteraceae bacterium]|nr:DUF4396 domain-containing protein [Pelagibacteraceae bacterium]
MTSKTLKINWNCKHTWKKSAKNTSWCLLGCSIGDFGTILFFQVTEIAFPIFGIMSLAIINGLLTSITLEIIILLRQKFKFKDAVRTAFGMSFISMISMELAMNITDVIITGGAMLNWYVLPLMLLAGFVTPLPYNYYKLKKYNISCH